MHAPCLFVVIPVAIVLVASTSGSSASPMHRNMLPTPGMHNRTRAPTAAHHGMHRTSAHNRSAAGSVRHQRVKHVISPRSPDALPPLLGLSLGELSSDHDGILSASDAFSRTAKSARSHPPHDSAYQQEAASGLTDYRNSLDPLQGLLAQLASEKGLANYDKSNKYETLLKDIVNASKNTLSDVDDIIDADPLLGPILGPIMYEIKCILDALLDATENITDGLLNSLGPLFKPLISSATDTVCRSILPPVSGLCVQV